jgi:hypothetical protein
LELTRSEAQHWVQKALRGFYDARLTAFTKNGELDESALRDLADFVENMTLWGLAKTGPHVLAFTLLKPWYEAIGLHGGYTLAPVEDVSPERREWLVDQLKSFGIA